MTTLDRTTFPMTGTSRPAIAVRVLNAVANFWTALKNRREIYSLGQMTNSELADIGLTRGDLHVAWRTPIGTDPTAHLGSIADARAALELRDAMERAARSVC